MSPATIILLCVLGGIGFVGLLCAGGR